MYFTSYCLKWDWWPVKENQSNGPNSPDLIKEGEFNQEIKSEYCW